MKKIICFIFLILFSLLYGCKNKTVKTTSLKENTQTIITENKYDYQINQDYFYGVGEVLVTENVTRESIDKRVEEMRKMGIKSHRFWIRVGRNGATASSHSLFRIEDNELKVNEKYYSDTIYALEKLKEAGITHITLNISWLYGKENGKYVYYGGGLISPLDPRYKDFLDTVYEVYYKVAELYSDYEYIEMGNEYNGNFCSFEGTSRHPLELKTQFILDLSYVASKAIKDASSNLKTVLNGVLDIEYVPADETNKVFIEEHSYRTLVRFFDYLYTAIESGEYPTISNEKSTNPDDYFEIIAYHPYTLKNINDWIKYNNEIYDVIIEHGDGGKRVFITEWGWEKINGEAAKLYKQIIENKEKTPYIEVIHYYIFSDAVDYSLYCLMKYNEETGNYDLTENGKILYEAYGIK